MAIRKIARMGHPVLRRRAAEVADPLAPGIQALIRDMLETMADAEGLGIAAPQFWHTPLAALLLTLAAVNVFKIPDILPGTTPWPEPSSTGWPRARVDDARHCRITPPTDNR